MKEKDIMLIQGPPGTGKTHTILGLISLFLLNNNGKILICAPSNAAIDEICARIATKGILNSDLTESNVKFLRFGLYDRYERENKFLKTQNGKILENYSLEYLSDQKYKSETENILSLLEKCNKKINLLNEKYNKIINISEKKSINFQLNELNLQKNSLLRNLSEKRSQKKKFEFDILTQSKIVCTTLNSSGSERLKNLLINFDYLIIDEACQCVEPSNLIPLSHKIKKLIMVGDHMQLPATVFSPNASKILYNRSLFERFLDNNYPRHILTIQYRMHSNIRNFIGQTFYENKLVDNEGYIKKLKENKIYQSINEKYNFCFFDISYGEEKIDMKSFNNIFEIDFIIKLILKIAKKINLEFDENNELNYF
jgi:senataxin